MDNLEKAILCTLHSINGIGNKRLWKIKDTFGSFLAFFEADTSRMHACLPAECVEKVIKNRSLNPLVNLEKLKAEGIKIVTIEDNDYPKSLRTIYDPPYVLYYQGSLEAVDSTCIAVVGSRKATPYGIDQAERLGQDLAQQRITVVSGMARGIDTAAHRGALKGKGLTLAVLGSGINVIYPKENTKIYHEIIDSGAVISEFPYNTNPEPGNFPIRNRIISGLSQGVVVVEAKKKSGALITADFALEQGRDVFAIPGPVSSPNSEGTNNLIKQGARLISGIEDILEEYSEIVPRLEPGKSREKELQFLDNEEKLIIQCMSYEPVHFDELIKNTGLEIGVLSTLLFKIEFKGIVKSLPGNYYVKIK